MVKTYPKQNKVLIVEDNLSIKILFFFFLSVLLLLSFWTIKTSRLEASEFQLRHNDPITLESITIDTTRSFPEDKIVGTGQGFYYKIREKLAVAMYYPPRARRRGYEGKSIVQFTIQKNGFLSDAFIHQPSNYSILDKAALQTVRNANPFPPIPADLNQDSINFKLPISFTLE